MTGTQGHWVRQLRIDADKRVAPVCSPAVLGPAIDQVGQDAVDWAVALGQDLALRAVERAPEFGAGPAQVATVRRGTESAALIAMCAIDNGDTTPPAITDDTIASIHDYVHRGIPLPSIWSSVRQGHAWLADAYMRACVDLVPIAEQPAQLQLASEVLFSFVDRFSDAIGREYGLEHERWVMTTVAARDEAVKSILAGSHTDIASAESILRYTLDHRTHLALILWSVAPQGNTGDSTLHKAAAAILHASGAEQTLLIPHGAATLYAWGNNTGQWTTDHLESILDQYTDVRAVLGAPHRDIDGFALTHNEAGEAREVLDTLPCLSRTLVAYRSVQLPTLLIHSPERIRRFIDSELGALASNDPSVSELRRTVLAYLNLKRSPSAVAAELYVVRNTVSYRIKRAEELLGRSLDERTLETWTALLLKEGLGDT